MSKKYLFLLIMLLTGCAPSATINNFSEYYNDENLDTTEYILRNENEDIEVIETISIDEKVKKYEQKGFVVLGYSYFQALWCPRALAIETAKEKGASLVIISSNHLGDKNFTYAIPYTQQHTVYHQGNISGSSHTIGNISNIYGAGANFNTTTNSYNSYSGTSSYYTTEYVTGSFKVSYYNQLALFLAKKQ